jgi:curli biogenesis system outer membrane secretion channel CsgG
MHKRYIMNLSSRHYLTAVFLVMSMSLPFIFSCQASAAEKPRIAVKTPIIGGSVSDSSKEFLDISKLLAELEASLQATRKFEVVSRRGEFLGQIKDEIDAAGSDMFKGNAAQGGQLENADYIVIPTVHSFQFYRSGSSVPNISDKYFRQDIGQIEIDVQVLDTSTGGIKSTFYLKSSAATDKEIVNAKGGVPGRSLFTSLSKKAGEQLADQLVDSVFPMRILNIETSQVYLNRGDDGGLKVGDILHVYRPGVELIDPDTGENLGSTETFIGKIKVNRVNPKFTIADVVEKEMKEPVQQGDIVREP